MSCRIADHQYSAHSVPVDTPFRINCAAKEELRNELRFHLNAAWSSESDPRKERHGGRLKWRIKAASQRGRGSTAGRQGAGVTVAKSAAHEFGTRHV